MTENEKKPVHKNFISSQAIGRFSVYFNSKVYSFDYPMGDTLEDIDSVLDYLTLEVKLSIKTKKEKEEQKQPVITEEKPPV